MPIKRLYHKHKNSPWFIKTLHESKSIFRFGIVSGIGLTIDMVLFQTLVTSSFDIILSNIISSLTAITFVFCSSGRFIFVEHHFSFRKYVFYVLYQVASILFFSLIIKQITLLFLLMPIISKAIVVPFSFLTNYLFLKFLTQTRHN